MKLLIFLISITIFFTQSVLAHDGAQDDRDPVARINYKKAFDFSKIQNNYKNLMLNLGCSENIFDNESEIDHDKYDQSGDYSLVILETNSDEISEEEEPRTLQKLKSYQKKCVKQLYSERRSIILRPGKEALLMMGMMGGAVGGVIFVTGANSFGGNIGVVSMAFNSIHYVRDLIKSGYNWYNTPPNPVDKYEIEYAKNQCFIPKAIWPKLETKFMQARGNPFEQQASLDFIEFTLGLRVFKPLKAIHKKIDLKQARQLLSAKIDQFFENYEGLDAKQKNHLKKNAQRFLGQLLGKHQSPRYLYLVGPGGIGKTHFARQLVQWFEKICPDALHLQELAITAPEELEGNASRPGAFLRVLRNQCQAKKKGSMVFMDEANWLNEPPFEATSKRVFNGAQSKLSTCYFGTGIDGTGVKLDVPPMLVIVASNNEIKEPALKSRFDCINFPMPTQAALQHHAGQLAFAHELADEIENFKNGHQIAENYREKLLEAIKQATNFREIESIVPAKMVEWEEELWNN